MKVPIQNVYYLFVYAWNRLQEASTVGTGAVAASNLENLLARLLIRSSEHLLRRGLDRGYVPHSEETTTLRGRIDFNQSIGRNLLSQCRAVCEFDEFTTDVLHNQILKATLAKLSNIESVDKAHRHELKALVRRFASITDIRISNRLFGQVQLHGNNAFYAFVLNVCWLVHQSLLPTTDEGHTKFRDVLTNDRLMEKVFQDFVFNFYKLEQSRYKVKVDEFDWDATGDTDVVRLPKMKTDVSLRSAERTIIIDTKYYKSPVQTNFGSESAHSRDLYQVFSYLMNLEKRSGPDGRAEGILLYPSVGNDLDLRYDIKGHSFRLKTLNLAQDWEHIDRDLRQLVDVPDATSAAVA